MIGKEYTPEVQSLTDWFAVQPEKHFPQNDGIPYTRRLENVAGLMNKLERWLGFLEQFAGY